MAELTCVSRIVSPTQFASASRRRMCTSATGASSTTPGSAGGDAPDASRRYRWKVARESLSRLGLASLGRAVHAG
jgi:hypothetical protein